MIKKDFEAYLRERFATYLEGCTKTQKEYALNEDAFDNFIRTGQELGISREKVLWISLKKHLDGIVSHIKGHTSQRESVHGRIQDAVMYLMLFDGMVVEKELLGLEHERISQSNVDNATNVENENFMTTHEDIALWNEIRESILRTLKKIKLN